MSNMVSFLPYKNKNHEKRTYFAIHMVRNLPYDGTYTLQLKNVVCSAAEAECAGIFHNCQKAIGIRRILEALGHKQTPTSVKTDNSTANSFVHATMRLKKSKTWDMRWN